MQRAQLAIFMFVPIRKDVFRWETPYPLNSQNLVGHIILRDSVCILVDPPHVPGLVEAVKRLCETTDIVLTSQNHLRGTAYIASMTGATVYVPEQDESAVEPGGLLALKTIGNYEKYVEGEVLGMKVFRDFYDFALLTPEGELIVSDNARGTPEGTLSLWPESMPDVPPNPPNENIHREFRQLVAESSATTLLSGHGCDIIGNLQELAEGL